MKPLFNSVFCLMFVLLLQFSRIEAKELATFDHYYSRDGLSCDYVHDIVQDSSGFLWVATEYGLSRFDGVRFKNYFVEDYPSIFRNEIMHLDVMSENRLLVAGNNGLLVAYDGETDSFVDLTPSDFESSYYKGITGFYERKDSTLLLSTTQGIYYYNRAEDEFVNDFQLGDSLAAFFITSMSEDRYGRFWFGTFPGVFVVERDGSLLRKNNLLTEGIMEIITGITPITDDLMLLSSVVGSLWTVNILEDGTVGAPKMVDTPFKGITSVLKDANGMLWVGTSGNGLWRGVYENGRFSFDVIEPVNDSGDGMKKVHALYEDRNGDIWIGTQNSGLWRYCPKRMSGVSHSSDLGFPLVDGTSFAEDDNGRILVGADGHGFFLLSPELREIRQFQEGDGLPSNNILSVKRDPHGLFWIASWGGLVAVFDAETFSVRVVPYSDISFAYSTSKVITTFPNGDVWVGMAGDGVYTYNKDDGWRRMVLQDSLLNDPSIPDRWVEHICGSAADVRWIITTRTVWRYENGEYHSVFPDVDKRQVHRPLTMYQGVCDDYGQLYVASNQGILRFSEDGGSYEWLSFMPKGSYSSILRDRNGIFWTSGSNGILSFDVRDSSFHAVSLGERCCGRNYFTCRASFQDSKGRLYFGSADGFVVFDPALLKESWGVDYLAFADLYLLGEKIAIGSDLLPKRLSSIDELKLDYDQTNLSVSFDIINFSGADNVNVAYRLVGLDRQWIDLGDKREVNISHIPAGEYRLEIKAWKVGASDEDSRQISMKIRVLPPWWATWWFKLLLTLFLVFAASMFFYLRFRAVVRQRERLREMVEARTQELDQSNKLLEQKQAVIERRNDDLVKALHEKDRLISVIAHDLKNPMFAIVGALETVVGRRDASEATWRTLKDVHQSAFNLQSVMVKLLEWARGKQDDVDCQLQDVDVQCLVDNVVELQRGVLSEKSIEVRTDFQLSNHAKADPRMIETSVRNLLSNAIKFTPRNGLIEICAKQDASIIRLVVRDHGVGMSEEALTALLLDGEHRSELGTDNERGTGLGFQIAKDYIRRSGGEVRIESKLSEGTCVTIDLPASATPLIRKTEVQFDESQPYEVNRDLLDGNVVLIVDDDPLILLHVKTLIEPYVQVLEAHNGAEALEMVKDREPDIIISDVEMPVMDGITMCQELRKHSVGQFVPLIFLSARSEISDRLVGLSTGAIDYIAKPFYGKELLMKLCNILQWRRSQQQSILSVSYQTDNLQPETNPLLKRLLEIVERRYTESELSVDDIATELAMSKSTLSRKLKSITDKTPIEILTEYRLHRAQEYLKKENRSVGDVAYLVGFNDPFYFSRKYKNFFGYPPSQKE